MTSSAENLSIKLSTALSVLALVASTLGGYWVYAQDKKHEDATEERKEHRNRLTAVEKQVLEERTDVVRELGDIKVQQQQIQGQYLRLEEVLRRIERTHPEQ